MNEVDHIELVNALFAEIELGGDDVILDMPQKEFLQGLREKAPEVVTPQPMAPQGPKQAPSLLDEFDNLRKIGLKNQVVHQYPNLDSVQDLSLLFQHVRDSHLFKKNDKHQEFLSGKGNPNHPKLLIASLRPYPEDLEIHMPFSGMQGKLLSSMLEKMLGIDRNLCYTTTLYKTPVKRAFPPKDRQFLQKVFLKEVEIVKPTALLLFGAEFAQILLGESVNEMELMKRVFQVAERKAFFTFHPQALIDHPGYRKSTVPFFQNVKGILNAL